MSYEQPPQIRLESDHCNLEGLQVLATLRSTRR